MQMAKYVDMDDCPCNNCAIVADCDPRYFGCQNYKKWYEGVDVVSYESVKECFEEIVKNVSLMFEKVGCNAEQKDGEHK